MAKSTEPSPDLPKPAQLSPQEDRRRTELFLSALGLKGEYLKLYADALPLKEAINTAISASGFVNGGDRENHFGFIATARLGMDRSTRARNALCNHLASHLSELTDDELEKLAGRLSQLIREIDPALLICDSKALKMYEKHSAIYDRDPAVVLLRTIGVNKPEAIDHSGFINVFYKLLQSSSLKILSGNLLPLPLGEGAIHTFLSRPTPAFAAQLGSILNKCSAKTKELVGRINDGNKRALGLLDRQSSLLTPVEKEESLWRSWVIQHVMEHLTHTATGRAISPLDVGELMKKIYKHTQFSLINFLGIALVSERTVGLMEFLLGKVRAGEMAYDDTHFPLEALTTEEGIHAAGKKLLEENRALREEIGKEAAARRY